jgi:hypothetical protein
MPWDSGEFNRELIAVVAAYDRAAAAALCARLIRHLVETDEPYPTKDAAAALQTLRNKRMFDLMRKVGGAFLQTGRDSLKLRRLHAQALIEEGELVGALIILRELAARAALLGDGTENAEARGLIGRVYKQMYVSTSESHAKHRREHLRHAVCAYLEVYAPAPLERLWHGINVVALLCRAKRDHVPCEGFIEPLALASQILAAVKAKGESTEVWDIAIALEASIALDDLGGACAWLDHYASSPDADAFELGSTLRQLTEVWQLDMLSKMGRLVLPPLQAQLLQRRGGRVEVSQQDLQAVPQVLDHGGHEKVFGPDSYKALRWYQTGLDRALLVARIGQDGDQGFGTGFLLKGSELSPSYGDDLVLLTNAHVVTDSAEVRAKYRALFPEEVVVTFEAHGSDEYQVAELLWTSPPENLDATVLRLTPSARLLAKVEGKLPAIALNLPIVEDGARVYIIGHPKGGGLSFSLQDNELLDHESPFIHYRAPTEGGSSGSPVFNAKWHLIGLHHAGREDMRRLNKKPGTYPANEGLWLRSIMAAIAESSPPPGS